MRNVLAVAAILLLGIARCLAQDAVPPPELTGAWHIEAAPDREPDRQQFSLVTAALDSAGTTLSIRCEPERLLYSLAVKDGELAELARGAEVVISMRQEGEEPARFEGASPGDGTALVQERVHQTAFSLILAAMSRSGAERIDLAVNEHRWVFSLQGFEPALQALTARCGFIPDPARSRHRADDGPPPPGRGGRPGGPQQGGPLMPVRPAAPAVSGGAPGGTSPGQGGN